MDRQIKVNDLVLHFKHELDTVDNKYKYVYVIVAIAKHTETGEVLVVYRNISSGTEYARPYDMFMSEVDREKYSYINQKFRFELI